MLNDESKRVIEIQVSEADLRLISSNAINQILNLQKEMERAQGTDEIAKVASEICKNQELIEFVDKTRAHIIKWAKSSN